MMTYKFDNESLVEKKSKKKKKEKKTNGLK